MRVVLAFLVYISSITNSYASTCSDVFPDPVVSNSANGSIQFNSTSRVIGSDGLLASPSMRDNTRGTSCDTAACQITGQPATSLTLARFEDSQGSQDKTLNSWSSDTLSAGHYDDVKLNQGSTLTATDEGVYYIDSLTLNSSSTMYLASGTYWISRLKLNQNTRLILESGANVTIYVESFTANNGSQINQENDAEPGNLTIVSYDDATFNQGSVTNAFFYAVDKVTLNSTAQLIGGVSAKTVKLNSSATVTYSSSSLQLLGNSGVCSASEQLPDPIGHWPFDICSLTGQPQDLPDIVAGNYGSSVNLPGIKEAGKYCQSGQFRGLQDVISIPHQAAYATANFSLSLWFSTDDLAFTNEPFNGGMTLVSKDASGFGSGGHFTISVTSAGIVQVKHQSEYASFQMQSLPLIEEGQWYHVVFTAGENGTQLFINNELAAYDNHYTGGLSGNSAMIVLAANASQHSGNTLDVNQLSDFYQGLLDDIRVYDEQLSAAQVSLLYALDSDDCVSCDSTATKVAHWDFDVCSLAGDEGEIVDVINGFNGTAEAVSLDDDGRLCKALNFSGSSFVEVTHQTDFAIPQGTLLFWVNLDSLSGNSNERLALISKDGNQSNSDGFFTVYVDGQGYLIFHQETSMATDEIYSAQAINAGTWHHVAYQWGAEGMQFYIDGVYQGGYSGSSYTWQNNEQSLIFGASGENLGVGDVTLPLLTSFLAGRLDDIQLYSGELSSGEVQAIYSTSDYACSSCGGLDPVSYYKFEDAEWDGEGTVSDSSENSNHGTPINNVSPELPNSPISCQGMRVTENTSSYVSALDTDIDVNDIGNKGTISFWYRSIDDWHGGEAKMLLDASKSYFYDIFVNSFYMYIDEDGRVNITIEDAYSSKATLYSDKLHFDDEDWVHIALAWNMSQQSIDLFINGQEKSLHGRNWFFSSSLDDFDSLKIGDRASNARFAYGTNNSANGYFDDVRVYNYVLSQQEISGDLQTVESCSALDHYEISHPTSVVTCSAATIQVKACANADCDELYTDPVSVSVSFANGEDTESVTFSGQTSLTLEVDSATSTTLLVSPLDNNSTAQNALECNADCSIEFVEAGFEFFDVSQPYSTLLPDSIAEASLSGVGIRAVYDNAGQCEALLEGTQSINLGFDCVSETNSEYSPDVCRQPFAGVAVQGDGSGTSYGAVELSFDSAGEANLDGLTYADAGQVQISANATIQGKSIQSGTAQIDIIPASLNAALTMSSPQTAGAPFSFAIQALGAAGGVLPSYQPGNLQMKLARLLPFDSDAADGGLVIANNVSLNSALSPSWNTLSKLTFTDGEYLSSEAIMEEVGTYQLSLQDSGYLGNTIGGNSPSTARIIPAYFDVELVTTPAFAPSCSNAFTYIGQSFGFETGTEPVLLVTAYNAIGQIAKNYSGALWSLAPGSDALGDIAYADDTNYAGSLSLVDAGNDPVVTANSAFNGEGEIWLTGAELRYEKIAAPSPVAGHGSPFATDITLAIAGSVLTDADGVCYQNNYPDGCEGIDIANINGTELRYGRVVIGNTYGPETESLLAPVVAEYYSSGNWILNSDDYCTAFNLSQSSGQIEVSNASMGNDEEDITSYLPNISSVGFITAGRAPDAGFSLGPALNGADALRGAVTITLDPSANDAFWAQYLNVDWNNDGDIDTNDKPSAEAFFGIYRGNDRTLHIREGF